MELDKKFKKDVAQASANLGREEARYLVDTYYQVQDFRIAVRAQCRSAGIDEPTNALVAMGDEFEAQEKFIKSCLEKYIKAQPIGEWLLSICGIGPVIAAGLIANIDIKKVQTAGQIWAFAGMDPTKKWNKGEKRPWNARLKTLCWKIGESFNKQKTRDGDIYGKLIDIRREYEEAKNARLEYAELAAVCVKNVGKNTEAYKAYAAGKLPDGHLFARSKRYAVKIFLSHLFDAWYHLENHQAPPKPFAIAILNHAHMIELPHQEIIDKYEAQYKKTH